MKIKIDLTKESLTAQSFQQPQSADVGQFTV